eukprot:5884468-Pleurochrysis_carterae.AAC.11
MHTAQRSFSLVVKNAFLRLRLWCSEQEKRREFDALALLTTHRRRTVFPLSQLSAVVLRLRRALSLAMLRRLPPAPCTFVRHAPWFAACAVRCRSPRTAVRRALPFTAERRALSFATC